MTIALRKPWTQDDFFAWAAEREGRFEFDGAGPVDVTGGSINHGIIALNLLVALRARLQGSAALVLGEVGVQTAGTAIRYPDAVVSFAPARGTERILRDATLVFEILGPSTERSDRTIKVREYACIPSLRRYCLIESEGAGFAVFSRTNANDDLAEEQRPAQPAQLDLPEIKAVIAISELYASVRFAEGERGTR